MVSWEWLGSRVQPHSTDNLCREAGGVFQGEVGPGILQFPSCRSTVVLSLSGCENALEARELSAEPQGRAGQGDCPSECQAGLAVGVR